MNTTSPRAPQPAHVPDAAVIDFDMFLDPALLKDPHARIAELLRTAPSVFWTPYNRGHWLAISHAEAFEVARDWEHFSSEYPTRQEIAALEAMMPPGSKRTPLPTPINMDPPNHGKYRAPLAAVFGPKAVNARAEAITRLADELIDAVADQGRCDFISAIAEPLPVKIFMQMMGLPLERFREFRQIVHAFLAPYTSDPMDGPRRMRMIADALSDVLLARKTEPRDDLISLLWKTEIDGEPMTMDLMEDYAVLLFIGGLDTVINGMGYGVRHMATDFATQDALRADLGLIPETVEELLRRYTFTIPQRRVAKDVVLGGFTLREGDFVSMCLPAADLDPTVFPQPEVFDLQRENKTHIAFGAGPHRCIGSHLARLELKIIYNRMLEKLPRFRIDPDKEITFRGGPILAIESLPIRWD